MGGLEVNRFKTFKKLVESKILSKSDRSLQEIGKKIWNLEEEAFFVKWKQYFFSQIQTEYVQVLEMEDLLWPWDQLLDLIAMGNLIKLWHLQSWRQKITLWEGVLVQVLQR